MYKISKRPIEGVVRTICYTTWRNFFFKNLQIKFKAVVDIETGQADWSRWIIQVTILYVDTLFISNQERLQKMEH